VADPVIDFTVFSGTCTPPMTRIGSSPDRSTLPTRPAISVLTETGWPATSRPVTVMV